MRLVAMLVPFAMMSLAPELVCAQEAYLPKMLKKIGISKGDGLNSKKLETLARSIESIESNMRWVTVGTTVVFIYCTTTN
jgi:hypothetical protein